MSKPKEGTVVARKEVTTGRTEDPRKDDVDLRREQCDGFGVFYATTFQIHGTSDMIVAVQRLQVLRLINAV
jgi:hypothetical protein